MYMLNALTKSLHNHDVETTFLAIPVDLRYSLYSL